MQQLQSHIQKPTQPQPIHISRQMPTVHACLHEQKQTVNKYACNVCHTTETAYYSEIRTSEAFLVTLTCRSCGDTLKQFIR
jgi:hypothetical protein